MFSSIGNPEIIDIAIVGATILMAAAGFWRGVVKEVFVSTSLLLASMVVIFWSDRWGKWIGDHTRLGTDSATFTTIVGTLLIGAILIGYGGSALAELPPADLPGRFGGAILGAANAVFAISYLILAAEDLVLDASRRATLHETRIGEWLFDNFDWVILAFAGVAFMLLIAAGWLGYRRSLTYVTLAGPPRGGASGFKIRRQAPLAPEAEKVPASGNFGGWPDATGMANTVPLTRVPDPSRVSDRPASEPLISLATDPGFPPSRQEAIRCVSCGERITEHDRFCPRCGRLLIAD